MSSKSNEQTYLQDAYQKDDPTDRKKERKKERAVSEGARNQSTPLPRVRPGWVLEQSGWLPPAGTISLAPMCLYRAFLLTIMSPILGFCNLG